MKHDRLLEWLLILGCLLASYRMGWWVARRNTINAFIEMRKQGIVTVTNKGMGLLER